MSADLPPSAAAPPLTKAENEMCDWIAQRALNVGDAVLGGRLLNDFRDELVAASREGGSSPDAPRRTPEGNLDLEHALAERDEARRQVRKLEREARERAAALPPTEVERERDVLWCLALTAEDSTIIERVTKRFNELRAAAPQQEERTP